MRKRLACLRKSLAMASEFGTPHTVSVANHNIGLFYLYQDDLDAAERHITEALAIARPLRTRLVEAHGSGALAIVRSRQGEHAEAIEIAKQAHGLLATAAPSQLAESLADLGEVHAAAGLAEAARGYYERALSLGRQRGEPSPQARAHAGLGRLLSSRDHLDAALEIYDRISPNEARRLRKSQRGAAA